jgi:hypothetical protein
VKVLVVALVVACAAAPAWAGDGRLEISSACVATGCFPGDSGGFPVTVPAGASAVMTSSLALPDSDTTAINVAEGATVDMNGFSIVGVTSCTGAPAACTGHGLGYGVTLAARATLRNGAVRRAGSHGVYGQEGSVVENLTLAENGASGFTASGKGQQILRCRILQNRQEGILLYYGSSYGALIQGNTLYGNGEYGLQVVGANVLDNVITHNGDEGAYMASGTGFGRNKLAENNGGNANDQFSGGVNLGGNVCGNAACP